jgi:hypothetical protein
VGFTVINKGHSGRTVRQWLAVQRGVGDATADALRVLDGYLVARRAILEGDLEPRPGLGYAGVQEQERSL